MATIQSPSTYNFAGNICDIIELTNNTVRFKLMCGTETLLDDTYTSHNARVEIHLRSFFEQLLSGEPLSQSPVQTTPLVSYKYSLNGVLSSSFYVLSGGVASSNIDTALFLKSNFLSWQPQVRHTSFHAPQWLKYVALQSASVFIKAYFADNTTQTITLASLSSNNSYVLDVSYGVVRGKFTPQPLYYDVWVSDSTKQLSYVQRYIYTESNSINDDFFVFENSLGGFDAVKLSGDSKEVIDTESRTTVIDSVTGEYNVTFRKSWQKYTGYLPDETHRQWMQEFFTSKMRFKVRDTSLERIYVSKPKIENTRGELSGYEFTYSLANSSKYLNLERGTLPANLEIVSPSEELFF